MGFWDRYDHPKKQPVPIDRMSGVTLMVAGTSLIASPICLGPTLAVAAIVMAHRVRRRLDPRDIGGARFVRRALAIAYPVLGGTVLFYALGAFVLLVWANSPSAGILAAAIVVLVSVVLGLATVTSGVVFLVVRLTERTNPRPAVTER